MPKWRMPEDVRGAGLIGPNAVLQLVPVLDTAIGAEARVALMEQAGVAMPDGTAMIPEGEAARLHRLVRLRVPGARELLAAAGRGTADYILAHRIPGPVQRVLTLLPAPFAARALSAAITRHAWTFAGSGGFRALTPWVFEISGNPLVAGERGEDPICQWHSAVFQRLYHVLVARGCGCREVACASAGASACRFEISRG